MPTKMTPSRTAIAIIVLAALRRLGRLERRHAVGDRLDAGQRDRAAGERAQQQERAQRLVSERDALGLARQRARASPVTMCAMPDGDDEQREAHEQVGGDGEDVARLAQAAQVADHDQGTATTPIATRQVEAAGTSEMTCSTADVVDTATVMT